MNGKGSPRPLAATIVFTFVQAAAFAKIQLTGTFTCADVKSPISVQSFLRAFPAALSALLVNEEIYVRRCLEVHNYKPLDAFCASIPRQNVRDPVQRCKTIPRVLQE